MLCRFKNLLNFIPTCHNNAKRFKFSNLLSFKKFSSDIKKSDINKSFISETEGTKQIPKLRGTNGARFETVNIHKQPNQTPAIELIRNVPVIEVHENIVACDGGDEKLGHPRIYINLDQNIPISCTYCGLRYQKI